MIKRINEGELLPPWYGCAWREWHTNQMVCVPIGLNLVASFIRACYFTMKHGGKWMRDNPRAAFDQGIKCGLELAMDGASHEQ